MKTFIQGIPKSELHLHIEGSLEPELMFEIGKRNNIKSKYASVEDLKKAYSFNNLQEFLDIYYEGASVLITEQDFYDMTWAYLQKIHEQKVIHAEIFFDPQTHTQRNIDFSTVVNGINKALEDGKNQLGISSRLIMCFLRHLSEADAHKTLHEAIPYKHIIYGIGLDSSELGNPPSKFQEVFKEAAKEGFIPVAHAGEEGPAAYVWEALQLLNVARIDHGNHSLDDEKLVNELVNKKMALTVCPLSNLKLKVVKDLKDHPIRTMLQKGLIATINSDDPAYFGGYVNENYIAVAEALNLTKAEIYQLAKNSFTASFLSDEAKNNMIAQLDEYYKKNS